jgi:uncharacterized protein
VTANKSILVRHSHEKQSDDSELIVERPLIVIQPTTYCNIDCDYCYLPERSQRKQASIDLIERIACEVFSAPWWRGEFTFLWHLGEPLVLPITYYEAAFKVISQAASKNGRNFIHSFQTNGMLLDENWANFFLNYGVRVGVSLDGPAFIHDRVRQTKRHNGTHAHVMRGVKQLQRANVPFGVISVLTDWSLDYASEMFSFFLENEITDLAFNIDELTGIHTATTFSEKKVVTRYCSFLKQFIGLINNNPGAIRLRELWKMLPGILNDIEPYNLANQMLRIVSFDCGGNYSAFSPELIAGKSDRFNNFVIGNVLREGLLAILQNNNFQSLNKEIQTGVSMCRSECKYWQFCGGGDPSSKFFQHGRFDVTETLTCQIHKKATVDAVLEYLESVPLNSKQSLMEIYGNRRLQTFARIL